jgi:ribonuclease HI
LKADSATISITIHFDGGSRGNPGLAGAGAEVLIMDNSSAGVPITTTYLIREYCGENVTNYFAEYKGLLAGLNQVQSIIEELMPKLTSIEYTDRPPPLFQLKVYGVNNLMIQQLRGEWGWKHPNLIPLFEESQRLIIELKQCGNIWPSHNVSVVSFNHVYREHNQIAYDLANEAIDQCKSGMTSPDDELSKQDVVHVKNER